MSSSLTHAHVRWFIDAPEQSPPFDWTPIYFLLIAGACGFGVISLVAEARLRPLYQMRFFRIWPKINQWRFLAIACGITFVFISWELIFIAPNITVVESLKVFIGVQAAVGVLLLSGASLSTSGVAVLSLCALTAVSVKPEIWVDYMFEFVAIGLAFILAKRHRNWAITVLRVGIGLQLMELAIHNKLMNAGLGLMFLEEYPWNIMQMMGLTFFDNLMFVFAAGLAELTFGLLIVLAIGTRFVVLVVSGFFMLTSVILGLHELIGHVPIIACCIVLFSLGKGLSLSESLAVFYRQLMGQNSTATP